MAKVKIGDFLFERKGKYKPSDTLIQDLKRIEKINFKGKIFIGDKLSKTNMILVKKGDLVISGINVAKGAMGIYEEDKDVVATIHYSSYTFDKEKINVGYFKRFLKSIEFIRLINEQIKGGIKTEIKPKHILPLEIDLPNLEIQNKIVKRFEKVESEITELNQEVLKQQTLLKKLRQSILQEGIEGKLTVSWREKNPDIESASVLLEKIKDEKENLVKAKKIKVQKPLSTIGKEAIPFEIPDGWVWCRLGDVIYGNPKNGYSPKAVDFETNTKTLKLGAITYGFFDERQYKYINEEIDKNSFLWLKNGDILIQRSNSLDYVGMAGIYDKEDNKYIYPDLIMKLNASQFMFNYFILRSLVSPFNRKYFQTNATGAQKNMPKINQTIVLNTMLPLPPREEQTQIVKKIESLFKLCDKLEEQIKRSKESSEKLMQSVLREAFEQKESVKELSIDEKALTAMAYIIENVPSKDLGRVKLQKILFMHGAVNNVDFGFNYKKCAFGPYDKPRLQELDKKLETVQWFKMQRGEVKTDRIIYVPLAKKDDYKANMNSLEKVEALKKMVKLMSPLSMTEAEVVATLYAVRKHEQTLFDFMPPDEVIIGKAIEWNERKKEIDRDLWKWGMKWLKDTELF